MFNCLTELKKYVEWRWRSLSHMKYWLTMTNNEWAPFHHSIIMNVPEHGGNSSMHDLLRVIYVVQAQKIKANRWISPQCNSKQNNRPKSNGDRWWKPPKRTGGAGCKNNPVNWVTRFVSASDPLFILVTLIPVIVAILLGIDSGRNHDTTKIHCPTSPLLAMTPSGPCAFRRIANRSFSYFLYVHVASSLSSSFPLIEIILNSTC